MFGILRCIAHNRTIADVIICGAAIPGSKVGNLPGRGGFWRPACGSLRWYYLAFLVKNL
jgi:hypothetical protein